MLQEENTGVDQGGFEDDEEKVWLEGPAPKRVLDEHALDRPISSIKLRPAVVVEEGTVLAEAIRLMRQRRIGSTIGTREGKLVGILTERDLMMHGVVGQKAAVTTLTNALREARIAHGYVFSGVRGVGKTTLARIFAKALNCVRGPTADPCGECDSCREIAEGHSLDVFEIDGASNSGVDKMRELLETVRYSPARDRYKVFIIDEFHQISRAAFNALLKTLEEPPPH